MMTYTAKVIADRNKARIEAINNPDNVLKMFQTKERNWLLPEEAEAENEHSAEKEVTAEAENKPVSPFLKGMLAGVWLSVAVLLVAVAVVLL